MLDDQYLGPRVLANPSMVQNLAIKDIESRLGGKIVIPDPNNAFTLLLDASSSLCAQFVRQEDKRFDAIYKQRAQTAQELYPFMSDYDYVNLMASPATLQLRMFLSKDWIIENAVSFDDNYDKLVIPETSQFMIGSHYFGLYYPIQILVNKVSGVISITYDITTINPLKSFSTDMLEAVSEYTYAGETFIDIVFDVWQFQTSVTTEIAIAETGFTKSYAYTNQFYAARVYTQLNGSSDWTELTYSMSHMVYDPSVATALVTPFTDTSVVKIEIPQIYFTNNLVGQSLKVVIYTTEGEISVSISDTEASEMQANFDTKSSPYAAPLLRIPSLNILPYNTTVIEGGSNPMDFADFRKAVVSDTLYTRAPISNLQLNAEVEKYGYTLYKYLDNITDRLLFAGAALNFSDGSAVPTIVSGILLDNDIIAAASNTIRALSDGLVTILPSTIFKYTTATDLSVPLSNADVAYLENLPLVSLVNELNTNIYTRQPFHLVLSTNSNTPVAKTFNLMTPTMLTLIFNYENMHSASQISVTNAVITHENNGTGGYLIKLGVKRSTALNTADPSQFKILLYTKDKTGARIHFEAEYYASSSSIDVFTVTIPLTYHISIDGYLTSTALTESNTTDSCQLALSEVFDIRLCIPKALEPDVAQSSTLAANVSTLYTDPYLVVAQQTMSIQFGEDMSALLYNVVTTTWGNEVYAVYPENVYQTYGKDEYLFDSKGMLVSSTVTDAATGKKSLSLVKICSKGDEVLSGSDFIVSITQSQTIPTATIAVSDVSNILVGSPVSGSGILVNTTVTAIDTTANTITLSQVPTVVSQGSTILVQNRISTKTVSTAQSAVGTDVVLSDVLYLVPGMTVKGLFIPDGTTIKSINASTNTITLSAATTQILPANTVIWCANLKGPKVIKHAAGDIKLDAAGNKVVQETRQNVYRVVAPQFDARLYASQAETDVAYVASLPTVISNNAHVLDNVRANMFERTELFYKPYKTLGQSTFGIGDDVTISMNLALSFSVVYYVTTAVQNNTSLCDQIEAQTISLISEYVTSGTITIAAIFALLTENFSGNIVAVDVLGVNNDPSLQTIVCEETEAIPSVSRKLIINVDGTMSLAPDINVTFKLAAS